MPKSTSGVSDLSEESQSIYSGSISSRSRKWTTAGARYRWSSNSDYILLTTACTLGMDSFASIAKHHNLDEEPNIVQFMVLYAAVGLPLVYIQVVIGQYTQMSIIFIRHMCPIAHGLAYNSLLNIFAHGINRALFLSIYLIYLLTSLRTDLQWLACPEMYLNQCWNGEMKCNNCLESRNLSAAIYFQVHHTNIGNKIVGNTSTNLPGEAKKLLPLMIAWALATSFIVYSQYNLRKALTFVVVTIFALMIMLFCVCIMTPNDSYFFSEILNLNSKRFFSLQAWVNAVDDTFMLLSLGRPFHVMAGSFLSPNSNAGILSVIAVFINFIAVVSLNCISMCCYGILKLASLTDDDQMLNVFTYKLMEILHNVIPQALSFVGVVQFWSFVYFLILTLLQICHLMVYILALEKSLCDAYPKLLRYRIYIIIGTTSIIFLGCAFLFTEESFHAYLVVRQGISRSDMLTSTVLISVICLVYGVQKLCDDIHFMSGSPPTKFWKICWYIVAPINIFVTAISTSSEFQQCKPEDKNILLLTILVFVVPIFTFATLEVFYFMKKKNLVGLFKPTDQFGPPDPEDKYLRLVYNPRTEIKARRRRDDCVHRCFLGNKAFRKALTEETPADAEKTNEILHNITLDLEAAGSMA